MNTGWHYRLGDLLAGAIIGAVVALAHHFLVPESLGKLGGAALGMFVGMGAQMLASVFLGMVLGQMEMMVPGMFVGMLGMALPLFQSQRLQEELLIGTVIGLLVFAAFTVWDAYRQGKHLQLLLPHELETGNSPAAGGFEGPPWLYDALEKSGSFRHAPFQKALFARMRDRALFVAAGSGLNFRHFPPGKEIVAIDLSPRMLETARSRASHYNGTLLLQHADVQQLPFSDGMFDTAATASTFCSVPDPIAGLREIHRVLKPAGTLLMFEHCRSRNVLLGFVLDLMTVATRHFGPAMNRNTVGNVQRAGFVVDRVVCAYLDIFLAIEAHKPVQAPVAPQEGNESCRN